MAERVSLREVGFTMRNVRTRMPFRYGAATLTSVPILHVRAEVELAGGSRAHGLSADILPPKWFDKDPAKSYEQNVDDLLFAAREAARAFTLASREPRSVFDIWRDGYAETLGAGDRRGLDHLTASHGSTLMERALIDAVGRAGGRTWHQLLTDPANPLGLDLGAILPSLAGTPPSAAVAPRPSESIAVRHTVGLADPIRDADVPAGEVLDDGLPQSLEAYLTVQGLRWLKVKVSGDHETDLERLTAIARLLDETPGTGRYAVSLDGNEQYTELDGFTSLLARLESDLPAFHEAIAYVEQPLERSVALDEEQAAAIAAVSARKPMIIDESDGDLDSFERAAELGYRGVSTKNCKGLFKALANAAFARRLSGERGIPFLITAEDLMNLPVVPLHQDLVHVAALGLDHAERNGHHYVRGLDHLSPPERETVLREHEGLYRRSGESGFLYVADGAIDVRSLQRCPGLGVGGAFDPGTIVPLEDWRFESLR